MARGKRGGTRVPENPAAVSGPGALSRRTDGGPGQPIRSFPAEFQGQRAELANLQSAAPLAAGGARSPLPPVGRGAPPAPPAGLSPQGILGPSQRPWEPPTAGIEGPKAIPDDPDVMLRAIYRVYPHPDILRLLPDGG